MPSTRDVLIGLFVDAKQAKGELASTTNSFKKFNAQISGIITLTSQSLSGLRQMAQGIQNIGIMVSAFIALPMGKALKDASDETMKFDDKMMAVWKTTGLTRSAVDDLAAGIRDLSKNTKTSKNDLADIAIEAGKLGVGVGMGVDDAIKAILEFTRVTDMMSIGTNLNAEQAAVAFGKMISVLQDVDVSNIENLGSAINELGQSSAASESEIVGAMMRIAPAAGALGLKAPEVVALSTAIVQLSESASRGGTRAREALDKMAIRVGNAAKLLGISVEEMTRMLEEDAMEAFMKILEAASQSSSQVEVARNIYYAFGETASNAIGRLSQAYPELVKYVDLANTAFEEGTSLQREFDRGMQSLISILGVVKNNIRDLGAEFFNSLLPIAKEFATVLIPAIQELAKWIGALTDRQKLLIMAIAGLVTIGPPILAMIGSIGFGIAMIASGMLNLVGGILKLVLTVAGLIKSIGFVSKMFSGLGLILTGVVVTAISVVIGRFEDLVKVVQDITSKAASWAESIIGEFAAGLIEAAGRYIVQAMEYIGNLISSFLEAHSPPETGPLSDIGNWGKRLIDTYLSSFKNADFSVLSELSNIISSILENMVFTGAIGKGDLGPALDAARTGLARLIKIFNETGAIALDVLDEITSRLGEAGDEVAKLITLQLAYNAAVKRLQDLEAQETGVQDRYEAEIRAIQARTDLTAAERNELIRQAKDKRNMSMANIAVEKQATQKTVSGLEQQVAWQKEYIQALRDTDDVWREYLETMRDISDRMKELGEDGKKSLAETLSQLLMQLDTIQKMQIIYKGKGLDITPLLRDELNTREKIVETLIEMNKQEPTGDAFAALSSGEQAAVNQRIAERNALIQDQTKRIGELQSILGSGAPDMFGTLEGAGKKSPIEETIASLEQNIKSFKQTLSEASSKWQDFKLGLSGRPITGRDIGLLEDQEMGKFIRYGQQVREIFDKVKAKVDAVKAAFQKFKDTIKSIGAEIGKLSKGTEGEGGILSKIPEWAKRALVALIAMKLGFGLVKKVVGGILTLTGARGLGGAFKIVRIGIFGIIGLAGVLAKKIYNILTGVGKVGGKAGSLLKTLGSNLIKAGGKIATFFGVLGKKLWSALGGLAPKIGSALGKVWTSIGGVVSKVFASIAPTLNRLWTKIVGISLKNIGYVFDLIFSGFSDFVKNAWTSISNLAGKIAGKISPVLGKISGVFTTAFSKIGSAIGPVLSKISGSFTAFFSKLSGILKPILTKAIGIIGPIFAKIGGFLKPIITKIGGVLLPILDKIGGKAAMLIGKFGKFGGALLRVGKLIGMVVGGGGLFVLLAAVIGGVIAYIIKHWDKFKNRFLRAFENIKKGVEGFITGFMSAMGLAGDGTGTFKEKITELWEKAQPIVAWLADKFVWVIQLIAAVIGSALPVIGEFFGAIVQGIIKVAKGIGEFFGGIIEFFRGVIDYFKAGGDEAKKEAAKNRIGQALKDMLGGLWDIVRGFLAPISKVFSGIFGFVKNLLDKIKERVNKSNFLKGVYKFVVKVIAWFQELYDKLVGGSIIPDLINGIMDWFKKAFDFIKSILGPIKQILKPVFDALKKVWKFISLVISVMRYGYAEGGLSGMFEALKKAAGPLIKILLNTIWSLMTAVPKVLLKLAPILWGFITKVFLPWAAGIVKKVAEYLAANLPTWISTIWNWLKIGAAKLWDWITTVLVPWAADIIGKVVEYLSENLPTWIATFLDWLGRAASALWDWITTSLLPWIGDVIVKVVNYLGENLPTWIATFLEWLGNLISALWSWTINTLLPWVWDLVKRIARYLWENLPTWIEAFLGLLGELVRKLWSWIRTDLVPWLLGIISWGVSILAAIGTEWVEKAKEGLGLVKSKFEEIFNSIKDTITQIIKDAMNGVIGWIESGVNSVIDAINWLIEQVNKITGAVGLPALEYLQSVKLPRLAKGGIAFEETLAVVGDVPEAIIPLDKLSTFFGEAGGGNTFEININNPVVRSDSDINAIADAVSRKLGAKLRGKIDLGNLGWGY